MATQSALQYCLTSIHSCIHSQTLTAMSSTQGDSNQSVTSSQGKVSCSVTPRHSARRSRGKNQQPSGYHSIYSTTWATWRQGMARPSGLNSPSPLNRVPHQGLRVYVEANTHRFPCVAWFGEIWDVLDPLRSMCCWGGLLDPKNHFNASSGLEPIWRWYVAAVFWENFISIELWGQIKVVITWF